MAKARPINPRPDWNYYYLSWNGLGDLYRMKGLPTINKSFYQLRHDGWRQDGFVSMPKNWIPYPPDKLKENFPQLFK